MMTDTLLDCGKATLVVSCKMLCHTIWIGTMASILYYWLTRLKPCITPKDRVHIGLGLLVSIPFFTCLATWHSEPTIPIYIDIQWFATLLLGWVIGIMVILLKIYQAYFAQKHIARNALPFQHTKHSNRIRKILSRLKRPTTPKVVIDPKNSAPRLVGIRKPIIVLPDRIDQDQCLEPILLHEMAHYLRRDHLLNFCQTILEATFFYHPAIRWLSSQIRIERENACDDFAISALEGNRLKYASALLSCETSGYKTPDEPGLTLAFGSTDSTSDRASRIAFGQPSKTGNRIGEWLLAIISSLLLLVSCFSIATLFAIDLKPSKAPPNIEIENRNPPLADSPPTSIKFSSWQNEGSPLFSSILIVEKNGVGYDLTKDQPRLFTEFPNRWLLTHHLDYTDSSLPNQDPDGDLFTNLEEYQFGTSPIDENSHPDPIHLLEYQSLNHQLYRIEFSAALDEKTIQLKRLPSNAYPKPTSKLLTVEQTTTDGIIQLGRIISKDEVEVTHLELKTKYTLRKRNPIAIRTNFAELKMRNETPFYVKKGDTFRIALKPGLSVKVYSLLDCEDSKVEITDGSKSYQIPKVTRK